MLLFHEKVISHHMTHKSLTDQLFQHLAADGREADWPVFSCIVTAAFLKDSCDLRLFPCLWYITTSECWKIVRKGPTMVSAVSFRTLW